MIRSLMSEIFNKFENFVEAMKYSLQMLGNVTLY